MDCLWLHRHPKRGGEGGIERVLVLEAGDAKDAFAWLQALERARNHYDALPVQCVHKAIPAPRCPGRSLRQTVCDNSSQQVVSVPLTPEQEAGQFSMEEF